MGNCCQAPVKREDIPPQPKLIIEHNVTTAHSKIDNGYTPEPTTVLQLKIERARQEGRKVVTAIYDYHAPAGDSDMDLTTKDILEVFNEECEWWWAMNLVTNKCGYIPCSYVTLYNSIEQNEWYHGEIDRKEAEKRLMAPGHARGTFLVRVSKPADGATVGYAISILDVGQQQSNNTGRTSVSSTGAAAAAGTKVVRHFRVRCLSDGRCMLSPKKIEPSLEKLIALYSVCEDGTNRAGSDAPLLTRACPKGKPELFDVSRNTRDQWQIDRNVLEFGDRLGIGQFGEVYKGRWLGCDVAIKSLVVGRMDAATFLAEATVMKQLRHRNLVALYAVCLDDEPFYIVTEFMTNGDLRGYLKRSSEDLLCKLTNKQLLDIATQVAAGMAYIHLQGIIHRDLAARNVLVAENNFVKIGDFGLARLVDTSTDSWAMSDKTKLPIKWTSPEAITERKFSFKSDVWSYGILLVELFTYGELPYKGIQTNELLLKLSTGYRHPRPTDCPSEVYDTMLYCWKRRPEERPTFEHLVDRMMNLEEIDKQYQEL